MNKRGTIQVYTHNTLKGDEYLGIVLLAGCSLASLWDELIKLDLINQQLAFFFLID